MSKRFDHVLDHVDAYFHDLLTSFEDQYIEQHCERCRICAVALEEAQKRHEVLQTVPASEASEQLVQATLARVETHEQRRAPRIRRLRRAALLGLAASVLLLGGLHLYYLNLTPSPHDLQVLSQPQLLADTEASLRVRVIDRNRNAPLGKVPVAIDLQDENTGRSIRLASFTTDEQGTGQPRFRLPDWKDGAYQLRVTAATGRTPEQVTQTVRLRRAWKVMLSSDRPVYQPGQEIHLRALALRSLDLRPVAGQQAVFTISDPKGNVIFKHRGTTSKFGISSADCPLASEILEGAYALRCQVGDSESGLTVEVKKYVLPKFHVELKPDQPYYQPGQRVRGKLEAAYFFGKPVAGGTVELQLSGGADKKVDERLSRRTDDKGTASFEFPPLPEVPSGEARLELRAIVTDSAGQKHERTAAVLVSAQPLRIEVVPEAGALVRGLVNTLYVLVSTPDGQPVKARVTVAGLAKELVSSDLGVTSFEVTPKSEEVSWTVEARADRRRSSREVRLECGKIAGDFILRTDRAVYRGGDTVKLTALGGGREPVFVDFLKDGQTMLTQVVALGDGRGQAHFTLPPELFGTVQLYAYRFGAEGQIVQKLRVLYIRPASQVNVRATPDRAEYRPGGTARVAFRLTDRHGKPTVGALSFAAVDEAVFSVLNAAPGTEQQFYTLDRRLLQSPAGMQPWTPESKRQAPAEEIGRFEQALFACLTDSGLSTGEKVRSSFRRNLCDYLETRESVLSALAVIWAIVGIIVGVIAYAAMWHFLSRVHVALIHTAALFFLCGLLGRFNTVMVNENPPQLLAQRLRGRIDPNDLFNMVKRPEDPSAFGIVRGPRFADGTSNIIILDDTSLNGAVYDRNRLLGPTPPRIREWFPETLLWRPELITDDRGRASLDIDLADSITTWRLTASAVTADGRLGAAQSSLKVFQPFFVDVNLPVALTRGDEIAVPVVLYNYLDTPQQVQLKLADAAWFDRLDGGERRLDLKPREVRSTFYRLRARQVGTHQLHVTATGSGVADAVKRRVEVLPDGRRVETVWNGNLRQPIRIPLAVPNNAIEGSPRLLVKLYPSRFSQLIEGLDAIFRMPSGCFEQTSSTTYPNVLALDYLRRSGKSLPAVEAKARHYIHLGYQRLLGFEVEGGGFDWFGRPPANRTLTAYGLMEFRDMAKVHDVDPRLIKRTRTWLLGCRKADGSWDPESHAPASLPAGGLAGDRLARLSTTAYVAWAVFAHPAAAVEAPPTRDFLLAHQPAAIRDPHALALVGNALLALDPSGRDARPYLDQLESLARTSDNHRLAWWEQAAEARTTFHGSGRGGSIETTALAALALLKAKRGPALAGAALAWLAGQRDSAGTWHSTQATVLALKALLAGTDAAAGAGERRLELVVDGHRRRLVIPADQAEVMKQLDLSEHLTPGAHTLTLAESTATAAGYQVAFRYHEPGEQQRPEEPLAIRVAYERARVQVGETLPATATVTNRMKQAAAMVMLDLPVPAGFAAVPEDLAKRVEEGKIAKYEIQARRIVVYLRDLAPGKALELRYGLRATMPAQVTVPAARVYEYYDPDRQGFSTVARLTVEARS
jgi:hypothetical protein